MRKIIIAVVALLMLGGGGAGAYFYFSQPAEASAGAAAVQEIAKGHDEKAQETKDGHGGGHGTGGTEFVELDPLVLPVIDNRGVTQTVSLVIALEVSTLEKVDQVKKTHAPPERCLYSGYVRRSEQPCGAEGRCGAGRCDQGAPEQDYCGCAR